MRSGRPPLENVERPPCPRGHDSRTLLDGHKKSPDGRFERPRYRCVDRATGEVLHRFMAPMSRRHRISVSGAHECSECERPLRRNDGQLAAHRFVYSIRDIASLLVRLGQGGYLRHVSEELRTELGRTAAKGRIAGLIGDSASPATHALDVFAPLVLETPERWPAIVAIDSSALRARHRKRRGPPLPPWPQSLKVKKRKPSGIVEIGRLLLATGCDRPGEPMRPLLVCFAGGGDEGAWTEFLRALPGEPAWVVSDRDRAINNAVTEVWPQAIHYFSHWHLAKNARAALAADKKIKGVARADLDAAIDGMLRRLGTFDEAAYLAHSHGARHLATWMQATRSVHRQQLIKQIGRPGFPKSASAAESALRDVAERMYSRRHFFTNVDRLNKLLGLIRNDIAHFASVARYSERIRTWVRSREGRVDADWHAAMDTWSSRSLDLAIAEAELRVKATRAVRQGPAKAARGRARQAAFEAERQGLGLPARTSLPKPIKARGSVLGKTVADFGWLLAEWHPTANGAVQPDEVPAGSGDHLWWKCPRGPDHEWQAQVRSRTIRGVRCTFCTRRRVAPSQSLAATHPEVAAEWHARNKRGPGEFTYGSQFEAWWQCPTYKTHVYQAQIRSRAVHKSGCSKCANLKRSKRRPRRLEHAA